MSLDRVIPSIQSLKQTAKKLASDKNIHLNQALDLLANDYGYTHWAILVKYFKSIHINNINSLWASFLPGEMLLLTAPEGAGKLSLALNIAALAAEQNVSVHYFSMHISRSFILERLNKIVEPGLISDWQRSGRLIINEERFDEITLLKEINNYPPGVLFVVDYLQAIRLSKNYGCYQDFLQEIKFIALQQKSRILILSQVNDKNSVDSLDCIAGGRSIARHFSHVIHIEQQKIEYQEQRDIALVKSIHYQKQKSVFKFNKENYRFV